MADLEKVAFGGEEIQYDKVSGLGSSFVLGNRDIPDLGRKFAREGDLKPESAGDAALDSVTAAAVQGTDAIETEAKAQEAPATIEPALLTISATPIPGTVEEQFISFPDSPQASADRNNTGDAEPAAVSPAIAQELPWNQASGNIRSPLLRLHTEIVEFCRFLEPSAEEAAMREAATQRVRQAVIAIFPSASVQVFGSFVTGLYLPTSDIDLVVMDSQTADVKTALYAVSRKLSELKLARSVQVIIKAKVPIIKFIEHESNVNFDISFDVANGPIAADFVRDLMDTLPPMKPLVLVLKIFLQQRQFNEVYQGGIGSYALFVMVAAFLLLHPSRHPSRAGSKRAGNLEQSMGVLLVDFFRLFGRSLNNEDVGISCADGGYFFNKVDTEKDQPQRSYMLSVEDPADPENDLCRGSWNFIKIKQALDFAYQQLTAPSSASESLLERIIRVDTVLTDRPRPKDPPVPEQLEQDIRDQMHHRSKRSRQEGSHKERKHKSKAKDADKDQDASRHKDKKRRRERSLEFRDPDEDAPIEQDREEPRSHRSGSREEEHGSKRERPKRSSSRDEGRSGKRHKEKHKDHGTHKHHKAEQHKVSRERSSSARQQSQHIRFN